jgi:hypothetical protein
MKRKAQALNILTKTLDAFWPCGGSPTRVGIGHRYVGQLLNIGIVHKGDTVIAAAGEDYIFNHKTSLSPIILALVGMGVKRIGMDHLLPVLKIVVTFTGDEVVAE